MERINPRSARYPFQANRDDAGVPHVRAATWREAVFALGYLHAIDRPSQLYFGRAVASGRSAELIANLPELLEMDVFLRRAGLDRWHQREVSFLPRGVLQQLEWYCQGVNDGLLDAGRTWPMWVSGFKPRPWDVQSVLAMGNLLSYAGLSITEQVSKREVLELIQLGVADERLRELFHPYLDGIDLAPLREIRVARRLSDEALELLADLPRLAGSNAWAVGPSRTASGSALLAGDPHLEVNRLPAIWYEVVLNWGEQEYVMGATLPGCPIMAFGRSRRLAWSVTYLRANTSDFFIEDCRPGGETGWQYRRENRWHDFAARQEVIKRKAADPVVVDVYENPQGVLTTVPDQPGKYLSLAWVGSQAGGGGAIGGWLEVLHAPSARAAMDVVRKVAHPALVWILADSDGHIASQASGWLPVRGGGHSGIAPIPAWDDRNHWQGVVKPDLLPCEYDPPIGFVASANEELYRPDGVPLHSFALPDYRKRRITEQLTSLHQATPEDMQRLQYDVLSTQARELVAVLLPHLDDGPIKDKLAEWDCCYEPSSTAATLFQHFYRYVLLEIFGHEEGIGWRRMLYLCTRMGFSTTVLAATDRILPKVTSSWWQVRDKGELIRRAAERAAQEPERPWAGTNAFHFVDRFFDVGRVGRLLGLRSPPIALRGCHATVFQGHLLTTATRQSTFAPSYHLVVDLGTNLAWTNLPGGPSESRFSGWYDSDVRRWLAGEYKELAADVESTEPMGR